MFRAPAHGTTLQDLVMDPDSTASPPEAEPAAMLTLRSTGRPAWVYGLFAALSLYFFLAAIKVMGGGLKAIGENSDVIDRVMGSADNPLVALFGAMLVTAIVQSSSFTTALIITMTGFGQMPVETAIFAVMGANIGTSVTNAIVSLGQLRIRKQFRRAFTAAIVHDFFNWLTVLVLLPIEWISGEMRGDGRGVLMRFSEWAATFFSSTELEKPFNPIKWVVSPVVDLVGGIAGLFGGSPVMQGTLVAVVGLALLFASLIFLVKNLKGALLRRLEGMFRRVFFRNDAIAYTVGCIATVFVQSSSVTTSLIVPLAGAGAVKLRRVYAYTLGANLGTTMTGVIVATANPEPAAVAVAIAHVTFNLVGTAIWYPLKAVPLSLARGYGRLAARSKRYAILFLLVMFIVVPVVGIVVSELIF